MANTPEELSVYYGLIEEWNRTKHRGAKWSDIALKKGCLTNINNDFSNEIEGLNINMITAEPPEVVFDDYLNVKGSRSAKIREISKIFSHCYGRENADFLIGNIFTSNQQSALSRVVLEWIEIFKRSDIKYEEFYLLFENCLRNLNYFSDCGIHFFDKLATIWYNLYFDKYDLLGLLAYEAKRGKAIFKDVVLVNLACKEKRVCN